MAGVLVLLVAVAVAFFVGGGFPFGGTGQVADEEGVLVPTFGSASPEASPPTCSSSPSSSGVSGYGPGAAWGDYDSDGDPDLFQACGDEVYLYRNENGSFQRRADAGGIDGGSDSVGGAWGDYDNDGCLDLFVLNHGSTDGTDDPGGPDALFRNECDGTFTNVTAEANVGGGKNHSTSAAWADYDRDGDLDLYVTNRGVVGEDGSFRSEANKLFENLGNGTFREVATAAGVAGASAEAPGNGEGPGKTGLATASAWFDFNQDRLPDLFVATAHGVDRLFQNIGNGEFRDVTDEAGMESPTSSWDANVGDFDQDGDLDLYVTNAGRDDVWTNNAGSPTADTLFTEVGERVGVVDLPSGGAGFEDLNHDGWLDVLVAPGPSPGGAADGDGAGEVQLYLNRRDGTFERHPVEGVSGERLNGGTAFADADGDGDRDAWLSAHGTTGILLRNNGPTTQGGAPGSSPGNWLKIEMVGNRSNIEGVGGLVTVTAGDLKMVREVHAGGGVLGGDSRAVHFGLGTNTEASSIEVLWPEGARQMVEGPVPANQTGLLKEAEMESVWDGC